MLLDTIDHEVFLKHLNELFGISGSVNDWIRSYLKKCSQSVVINVTLSDRINLEYGFPQGSKIDPFGFKLYTKLLSTIAKKHNVSLHLYADDTQLYLPFDPENYIPAMRQIEACIADKKMMDGK